MKKLFGVFKRSLMRYFTKEKPDIHAEEAKTSSFCTNAITDVLETDGKRWLIPINIVLFLPGMLFLIACDLVQAHTQDTVPSLVCVVISCMFFVLKFDAWKIKDHKNILKLMYIVGVGFSGGYAAITYLFLVIYENIVAYSDWRGKENVESTL